MGNPLARWLDVILTRTRVSRIAVAALSLAAAFEGVAAGQSAARVHRVSAAGVAARAASAPRTATTIFGYLWTADSQPIANATLRLRNVVSGRVEATTVSNAGGEFTFTDVEGGTYVIEYVDDNGKLLAVGHTFSVAPGETVATFVRLGARRGWFSGVFGSTAAAAVSSAAGLGVTAVAPTGRPATRNR